MLEAANVACSTDEELSSLLFNSTPTDVFQFQTVTSLEDIYKTLHINTFHTKGFILLFLHVQSYPTPGSPL